MRLLGQDMSTIRHRVNKQEDGRSAVEARLLAAIELPVLRTFLAAAQLKSFSHAATVLECSPASVCRQIQKLEDAIGGVAVFQRGARSIQLSYVGTQMVEHAKRMLAINAAAMSIFVDRSNIESVRIGIPDNLHESFLTRALRSLSKEFPSIAINVVVATRSELKICYEKSLLNMVFGLSTQRPDSGEETIFSDTLVWMGARHGSASRKNPLPLAVGEEACCCRLAATRRLKEVGRKYRIAFLANHPATQLAAVAADLTVAPLPKSLAGGGIIELPATDCFPHLPSIYITLATTRKNSPMAKVISDCILSSTK